MTIHALGFAAGQTQDYHLASMYFHQYILAKDINWITTIYPRDTEDAFAVASQELLHYLSFYNTHILFIFGSDDSTINAICKNLSEKTPVVFHSADPSYISLIQSLCPNALPHKPSSQPADYYFIDARAIKTFSTESAVNQISPHTNIIITHYSHKLDTDQQAFATIQSLLDHIIANFA